jgi:hypothetical protein
MGEFNGYLHAQNEIRYDSLPGKVVDLTYLSHPDRTEKRETVEIVRLYESPKYGPMFEANAVGRGAKMGGWIVLNIPIQGVRIHSVEPE